MRTIAAREIKRRGISAVDDALKEGPVHVIQNDRPKYVILNENQFRELMTEYNDAYVADVRASLEDLSAGRVRRSSAQEMIDEFGLED